MKPNERRDRSVSMCSVREPQGTPTPMGKVEAQNDGDREDAERFSDKSRSEEVSRRRENVAEKTSTLRPSD